MKRRFRAPSPALVISLIALFVALGGTSYAAITALPRNSVGTPQLKHNAVTSAKIKNGAVTAAKINTSGLTVPNSNALGGLAASGYVVRACGPITGQIKGFARINDATVSASSLSTTGVTVAYNCSGESVTARRISTGKYEVKFVGSPAGIAYATGEETTFSTPGNWAVNSASVNEVGPGDFYVQLWNDPTSQFVDGSFVIWTP